MAASAGVGGAVAAHLVHDDDDAAAAPLGRQRARSSRRAPRAMPRRGTRRPAEPRRGGRAGEVGGGRVRRRGRTRPCSRTGCRSRAPRGPRPAARRAGSRARRCAPRTCPCRATRTCTAPRPGVGAAGADVVEAEHPARSELGRGVAPVAVQAEVIGARGLADDEHEQRRLRPAGMTRPERGTGADRHQRARPPCQRLEGQLGESGQRRERVRQVAQAHVVAHQWSEHAEARGDAAGADRQRQRRRRARRARRRVAAATGTICSGSSHSNRGPGDEQHVARAAPRSADRAPRRGSWRRHWPACSCR